MRGYCFSAFDFYFISDSALPACVSVHHTYALLWRPEDGVGSSGTVITDGSQSPFVCCKSNPGPREEKPLLLTTEPALWFDFPFSSIHALCVTQAGLQLMVFPLIPSAGITVMCHHTSCNYRVLNFLLSLSVFAQTLPLFSPLKKQTGCPKEGTVVDAGIRSLCIFLTFLLLC